MRWKLFLLFVVLFAAGCSADKGKDCVDTLCTAGTTTCMGNYTATCSLDGRHWSLHFCGDRHVCEKGKCKPNACVPGLRFCDSDSRATVCDQQGMHEESQTCGEGTLCQYGFCLPKRCTDGAMHCNNDEMVVCRSGLWTTEQCPEGEVCSDKEQKCVKKRCTPFQATCFKGDSAVCGYNGGDVNIRKCKSNEECVQGFCMPKVCAITHDAGINEDLLMDAADMNQDTSMPDIPAVDQGSDQAAPGVNRAQINGSVVDFSVTHTCAYSPAQQQLKCMFKAPQTIKDEIPHQDRVTILLTGIQENQTGEFHCQDHKDVRVNIYYKWGKYPDNGQCADYDYIATKCTVNITRFGMSQGVVSGSFEAPVMEDCTQDNTKAVITNGEFNANRMF